MMKSALSHCALIVLIAGCAAGCGRPRSLEEIEADRRSLPVLYLTEKTLRPVQAPTTAGVFVDEATGELCYRAYECIVPDCPGRSATGEPFLFIHRDVLTTVGPTGEIIHEDIPAGQDPRKYIASKGGHVSPTCPKCLETRDLASENDADRLRYAQSIRQYELPEIAARRQELEAEYQSAFDAREALRQGR